MNVEQYQRASESPDVCLRIIGSISQREFSSESDPLSPHFNSVGEGGKLRIDLSGTEFIDSSGIGWLIRAHQHLANCGNELVLQAPSPMVLRSFQVLRLDSIIKIENG